MSGEISIRVNGRSTVVPPGTTVAAALPAAGEDEFRRSVRGEPRGPLCAMGICFECRVTINGIAHCKACQTVCAPGMEILTGTPEARYGACASMPVCYHSSEIVVVGGGPAGLAAASAARRSRRTVLLVDENPWLGGQIRRPRKPDADSLIETRVVAQPDPGVLLAESPVGPRVIRYERLILAPGARECFLPFPGWTLPGVTGAGGLQSLVKSGLPIAGKNVVVAGTGPLLIAVAMYLRKRGAHVVLVAEQTGWRSLARFAGTLLRHPAKAAEALGFAGLPYAAGCWPVAAEGEGRVEAAVLERGGRRSRIACDYLACGFGLAANLELPLLLGCSVHDGSVQVDEGQQTSVDGIYYAGSPGGVDLVEAEGEIAGNACAGNMEGARRAIATRDRARRFKAALDRTFALRDELRTLATAETVVCRCEDVTLGELRRHQHWRAAKLETRCGMGACQGRVCGQAVEFLLGWKAESIRPPVFPVRAETIVAQRARGS